MKISEKLYTLRKRRGLSQERLAEKLNVSRQAISKWELGTAIPESEKLIAISQFFGVSLDDLVNEERDLESPPITEQPSQKSTRRTQRIFGVAICIVGIVCLAVWGILSVLDPPASEQIGASSAIELDGNGILVLVCAVAIIFGAILATKSWKKK